MPLAAPNFLKLALAQPVAIFGGGVSGAGVCALLAEMGVHGRIYDGDAARGSPFTPAAARQHRLVVYSPGFPPEHPWLQRARAAGLHCLGELDFASLFWSGKLIAITGTNGKTTVTEFLTHALGVAGRDAHVAGNIGHPLTRLVAEKRGGAKDSFAVCEISSFQSETLEHLRADATLWTNFAEDHLERHPGLESYFSAKWKLVAHTDAGAVYAGSSVLRYAQQFGRPAPALVGVPTENQPGDLRLIGTIFAEYPQRENFLLVEAWWRANGLPESALVAAARSFKLGRHRLARVGEHDGITFWNDSKATNFHATEAALAAFRAPVVLIAGGKSKGGDLAGFVGRIARRVKHLVLIGETSGELAFHCAAFHVAASTCGDLGEAVRRATELADDGDHVLLSPGFASFDMFRNYEDRGAQFEALVKNVTVPASSLG
jgi:UDP-N-acetylmuramoylalanine--D-glutamate ligase